MSYSVILQLVLLSKVYGNDIRIYSYLTTAFKDALHLRFM